MDFWSDDQIKKMQVGGNKKAIDYFTENGIQDLPIKEKYSSAAAENYREKIQAEAEGRTWTKKAIPARPQKSSPSSSVESSRTNISNNRRPNRQRAKAPEVDPVKKQEFFNRKHLENESRPLDIPPSEGGRYAGFGNTSYVPPPKDDHSSWNQGWSAFTDAVGQGVKMAMHGAEVIGHKVNEKLITPTIQAAPQIKKNVLDFLAPQPAQRMSHRGQRSETHQSSTENSSRGSREMNSSEEVSRRANTDWEEWE